jgi:hypothetical protein
VSAPPHHTAAARCCDMHRLPHARLPGVHTTRRRMPAGCCKGSWGWTSHTHTPHESDATCSARCPRCATPHAQQPSFIPSHTSAGCTRAPACTQARASNDDRSRHRAHADALVTAPHARQCHNALLQQLPRCDACEAQVLLKCAYTALRQPTVTTSRHEHTHTHTPTHAHTRAHTHTHTNTRVSCCNIPLD